MDFRNDPDYIAAWALMDSKDDGGTDVNRRVCCSEADTILVSAG